MSGIPCSALILGVTGLIPFVWGAAMTLGLVASDMNDLTVESYWQRVFADGPTLLIDYGTIILSFMSGVLWGFATRAKGRMQALGFALSVVPALWAFIAVTGPLPTQAMNLILGFVGLLALDWVFTRARLTPPWWMRLRVLLTAIVVACLIPVVV